MALANAPAVENNFVAGFPQRGMTFLHRPRAIDTRHHRKLAHHRRLAGDGEAIFVVDGGIIDANGHIAFRQIAFVDVGDFRFGAGVGFA